MTGHGEPAYDPRRVRGAYDGAARAYAAAFGDELELLPLDAMLVDRLLSASAGPVLELGAGVAPVARRARATPAVRVVACDLSAGMLAHAPSSCDRVQADARALPFASATFGAAVARYVLQHLPRRDLPLAIEEVRRVLRPGVLLLVAVHLGTGEIELSELLGTRFEPIGGAFHTADELRTLLDTAGFRLVAQYERGPVPGEADTQRLYLLASARRG